MGFILIDFGKREERGKLKKLVSVLTRRMDIWIGSQYNDGTPPPEDTCSELEDAFIAQLMEEYKKGTSEGRLNRVKGEHELYRQKLETTLNKKKGLLYARFSGTVDKLRSKAVLVLNSCVDALNESEGELRAGFPVAPETIEKEFEELIAGVNEEIEAIYPNGVKGLDDYDDGLPDGVPSHLQWLEQVASK